MEGKIMKSQFIVDIQSDISNNPVTILGWCKGKRCHKKIVFLDLCDSTGSIQVTVDQQKVPIDEFEIARLITCESAVRVEGIVRREGKNNQNQTEILCSKLQLINKATGLISPKLREDIDIFNPHLAEHLLNHRSLYIRNPKVMAILRFRHILMGFVHQWFREHQFIEITAPILTPLPLYDDRSAIEVNIHDDHVFLTQCVGFYLEAAVHAFERVYNIGPSFRGEESHSKRHLMEYWHIKAEIAFGNREDIIAIVEELVSFLVSQCANFCQDVAKALGTDICIDGLTPPFPRISYREAIQRLQTAGQEATFGKSLCSKGEGLLAQQFSTPFWVVGIPRSIEPFPYVIDPDDLEVTMTADLVASKGYGELLGVAEKIHTSDILAERMREKGKQDNPKYEWVRELREFGCVPHIGFGMGVERFIRWLLQIPHVRDAIPFPRIFRRKIHP
ncbi:hypothetical protein A3I35_02175 [Candidatus Falkowbacteria bacterium RIFCSPLOWO2_02_FULL_45_15]|uniref:Aminoacyl-transfer RNA synthetases class-II family profile domain-containing protein n=2 Tax=Parcubacteria group TaxID=1794811 RepID=A0A1G1YQS4_9BACT|nr:MAG: hypothetical protein A3I35_02175 [Candidatus Falkowbacteria bacterium RIFCSPLOWO2_02_FULL_45_15]OGY53777.1 MAG: hypothetical protein A3B15_00535 [Candidatus Buchananbacteria bacterium RIFCSPLOWO2_01_FULL_45_31]